MAIDRPAFGALLRRLRLEANVSQELLAERARISKQAVSALERGTRRSPQRKTLALLAEALQLDAVRRGELERAASASAPARIRRSSGNKASTATRRSSLPSIPTSFVGREIDCRRLATLLAPGWCTTVWGSGGIGKTRLALECARAVESRFADGAWFVELPDVNDENEIARTICATAGVHEEANRPIVVSLVAALCEKNALLVLDNAEQVVAACALVVERLAREAPSLTMLCTSREVLRIPSERVFRLEPLPVPDGNEPDLAATSAVRLFIDRAENAGAYIDADRDLPAVADICRRLDAIPLALELAAARAPLMRPAQIVDALDDRFRILTRGNRAARAHQQTLLGTLSWSAGLLTETERIVLRRLGSWPSSWTLDDAVAVVTDDVIAPSAVIEAVGGLVDRSLVVADETHAYERLFRLLQTTRAYAKDCAIAANELARCERAQAERVRNILQKVRVARERGQVLHLHLDISALRTALHWCISLGNDVSLGAVIAGDASRTWEAHNMQIEGLRWIDDVLVALGPDAADAFAALIGRARLTRGLMMFLETAQSAERALLVAEREMDARRCAEARLCMGFSAGVAIDEALGRRLLDDAARGFSALGDRRSELLARSEIAALAIHFEHIIEARDLLEPLVVAFREAGDERSAILTAGDLADAYFSLGDTPSALARARDVLERLRALDAALPLCTTLENMTAYLLDMGDVRAAMAHAGEALEIADAHEYRLHVAIGTGHVADALAAKGEYTDAARLLGYADRYLREAGVDHAMETERRGRRRVIERCTAALQSSGLNAGLADGANLSDAEAVTVAFDAISVLCE